MTEFVGFNPPVSPATLQPVVKSTLRHFLKKNWSIFAVVLLGVSLTGVVSTVAYVSQSNTDGRVAAVSQDGTATLSLQPAASSTFSPNVTGSIDVVMNSGLSVIDGVQMVINVSGTMPGNIQFVPNLPAGLEAVVNQTTVADATQLKVGIVTTVPETGFTTQNQAVRVGSISFTAPSAGAWQMAFDPTLTKIVQHSVAADILAVPSTGRYSVASEAPTPSVVVSTNPSSVPLPSPSIIVIASPTPVPTPTVSTIVVQQARWREWPYRWNQLTVRATSQLGAAGKLEVVGFGKLGFNKRTGVWSKTFYTNKKPLTIVIKDSAGNQVTVPVEIIKFGK